MKKLLKAATLLGLLIALAQPASAEVAYTENWVITNFNSDIILNIDGSADITETITADFTNETHRGIERSIPYEYTNGRTTPISALKVSNPDGNPWDIETFRENGYFFVQMTTPDNRQLKETATFKIEYKVSNVFNYLEDSEEFFWNVNGTSWVVPTTTITGTVNIPTASEDTKIKCITGLYGGTGDSCTITAEKNIIEFSSTRPFEAYENLSIVIGLPKGTIAQPSEFQKFLWFLKTNPGVFFPVIAFAIMFTLWHKKGRDDRSVRDTIIPHYKPPQGLLPSETGTIIDEKLDPKDITATIIDHAIKGEIEITETDDDFELKLKKPYTSTKEFETKILSEIFPNNEAGRKTGIASLKNKFGRSVTTIKKITMNQLVKDGYFPHNPDTIRKLYMLPGAGVLIAVFNALGYLKPTTSIGLIISAVIILIFGYRMPRKTLKGTETYYELKGLYEYIDTAEKDRMKFQEDNNLMFEKLLPYAMSFGLIKKWTNAFEGLISQPPSWYTPMRPWSQHPFSMAYLSDRLSKFGSKTTSYIATKPGGRGGAWSGGSGFSGGFSGGGFGGGGGRGL